LRQNILLDVLLDDKLSNVQKSFANGIFLNLAKVLLGWHYTEFSSSKGKTLTIYNFDLHKSDALMKLRERILSHVYYLFETENEQSEKVLHQIVYPGGDIDKSIYVEELPIYQKLISGKLDNKQYAQCKFVCVLAKHLTEAETAYPENWNQFIESDIRKLSKFLKPDWEYRDGKSVDESEKEKRKEFDDFIRIKDWENIERFLLNIDDLYKQQKDSNGWHIESAVTDIYVSIARKDKREFENALRLFFSGKVLFPLRTTVMNVALLDSIMTGKEILSVMNEYEFLGKPYWESVLVAMLPEEQVNESFLKLLIKTFQNSENNIYVYRMLDYSKYNKVFEEYKKVNPQLEHHNIITYLTSIILTKTHKTRRDFGFRFCAECVSYFVNHQNLLKDAYWAQYEIDHHFDYDGKELKAILDLDKFFINDSLKNGTIDFGYSSNIRLENINTSMLWEYAECEELIEDILLTILDKEKYLFIAEEDIYSLFTFRNADDNRTKKIKSLVIKLTQKYSTNENVILMLLEVVYHNFRDWFMEYFKEFLLLNKDISIVKKISFGRSESWSGSRVPLIQKKIEFYEGILKMINTLPDILNYSEHIDYFEQKIGWKKKEIEEEQKRDFMEEFY
jgi:hypothetical protein